MKIMVEKFFKDNAFIILTYQLLFVLTHIVYFYGLGYLISIIEDGVTFSQGFSLVIIFGIIMALSGIMYEGLETRLDFSIFKSRMKKLYGVSELSLKARYETFCNQGFNSKVRRALEFFSADNEGYQPSIKSSIDAIPLLILIIYSGCILFNFVSIFPLISLLFIFLSFPFRNRVNTFDLLEDADLGNLDNRKEYYHYLTTDSSNYKDIGVFGLKDMILSRYSEIIILLNNFIKRRSKILLKSYIFHDVLNIINDGILIFFLINKGNRIGSITTIFAMHILFSECSLKLGESLLSFKKNSALYASYEDELISNRQDYNEIYMKEIFKISFEDVSFSYPNSDDIVLENINTSFLSNERIGLVGENGAGKSTFIKILIGLLDPSEGRILINDMELSKDDRLNLFATSFQTSKLFAGSVRDNIPSDKINLNFLKEYISEYNLGFNIDEFLEKKIGDQFYDNAYKPSGGMEQAIISLRLFLSENPFLVFDEPTSALDIDKELKFYERLKKTSDRGYLIVSHRLSLSNAVDKIIVINNRTIEAFGDYDQLIEKSSYFKELNEEFKKIFNGEDYV